MNKHYDKLIRTLRTLFEMDRADLDFGFYRIMHAKAEQVQEFIEKDLLQTVKEAFGEQSSQNTQELLEQARQKVIQTLGEDALDADGNLKPAFSSIPAGKQYQDEVAQILRKKDDASSETDVYDHLCRFFERYYEGGDFVSRRYYARETSGKAAPYAIPYNGEEVKLHWANADQYYIKTTENYNNFTFDLRQAREVQAALENTPILAAQSETDKTKTALRVHFRIKEAAEGEHGNVKATDATKRFFVLHSEQPVEKDEAGELVVNFEYKPLPGGKYAIDSETEKQLKALYGSMNKGDMPVFDMATQILTAVESMEGMAEYCRLLQVLSPTEKIKKRPLIVRYLNKYTAANTMDYFIHKDLGGFLRRELDFYIKNEVMHLDDIENADVPAVESYLARIKVLRTIAGKLIDFLAQLEDFQKKLWLKKKFVVETNYCLTLDRVPEKLYGEIVGCEAQWLEWVGLGFLTTDDTKGPEKRREILEKEPYLVLDTKFYGEEFKEGLLVSFDNLHEQCDGLLIHSENFQALSIISKKYNQQLKTIYLDPPYNTGDDGFAYKDAYKHSTWMSMLSQVLTITRLLLRNDSLLYTSIDRDENRNLLPLFFSLYGEENFVEEFVWQKAYGGGSKTKLINNLHEYIICFAEQKNSLPKLWLPPDPGVLKYYKYKDDKFTIRGMFRTQPLYTNSNDYRENLTYPLPVPKECNPGTKKWKIEWDNIREQLKNNTLMLQGSPNKWEFIATIKEKSAPWLGETVFSKKQWQWEWERTREAIINDELVFKKSKSEWTVDYKQYQRDEAGVERGSKPPSILIGPYTQSGTSELKKLFSLEVMKFPKPMGLIKKLISIDYTDNNAIFGDWFAGSGTTGHAVITLNREDGGKRKYILIEMGDYFDTVLKPRIQKIIYSENWKDGKPKPDTKGNLNGITHTFKYLRLESYEDTLNNLRFNDNKERDKAMATNPSLKEDFVLNYLLDVETRGSQSLLNIDNFADPRRYTLKVKKLGSEEYNTQNIDLIETFNYLIGLRVTHLAASQTFKAAFKRNPDPELPEDQHTKLVLDGTIRQDENGPWWFRKIEGRLPRDPAKPNNGQKQKILIVWRNLTGDLEQDNAVLDEWFQKNRISTQDFEFDTIYINGSNNLPNLQKEGDIWKVRLIEEEFMKRMWDVEGT